MKNLGVKEIHVFLINCPAKLYIYRETELELDSVSISLGLLSYYI